MTPPDANLISLVIPACNEAESLTALFDEIDVAVATLKRATEVIVIDDGSRDGTWQAIQARSKTDPRYRGIRFRRNFGKAAALDAGFKCAHGGIVITLDADLQDDPAEIPRFLAAIDGGLDVVSGWKKIRHDPWHKVMPSRVFNAVVSRVTGVNLHDHNCGFKAIRAEALGELRLYGERHRFIPVLAASRGFRTGEIVIQHRARKHGRSHYGLRRFVKGFLDLLTVRFLTAFGHRPQHTLGTVSLVPIMLGLFGLFVVLIGLLFNWPGMTTVFLLSIFSVGALLGGALLFVAGLLAELIVERGARVPEACIVETTTNFTPQ